MAVCLFLGILGALHGGSFPRRVNGQGSSQVAHVDGCRAATAQELPTAGGQSPHWAGADRRWRPAGYWVALRRGLSSHTASGHSIRDTSHWVLFPWALLKPFLIFLRYLPALTRRTLVATGDGEGTPSSLKDSGELPQRHSKVMLCSPDTNIICFMVWAFGCPLGLVWECPKHSLVQNKWEEGGGRVEEGQPGAQASAKGLRRHRAEGHLRSPLTGCLLVERPCANPTFSSKLLYSRSLMQCPELKQLLHNDSCK